MPRLHESQPTPPAKSQTATLHQKQPPLNSPGVRGRAKTNEQTREQNKTERLMDEQETIQRIHARDRESTWRRSGATRARAANCSRRAARGAAEEEGRETEEEEEESRRICGGEGEDWGVGWLGCGGRGCARARIFPSSGTRDHVTRASRASKSAAIGRWGSSAPVWGGARREAVRAGRACGSGSAPGRVGSRERWGRVAVAGRTRGCGLRLSFLSVSLLLLLCSRFISRRPPGIGLAGRLPGRLGTTAAQACGTSHVRRCPCALIATESSVSLSLSNKKNDVCLTVCILSSR